MVRASEVIKTDVRVWEEHLKVNLTGAFLCSLKVLPGMISRGRGSIINVASIYGQQGEPNLAAYCASKAGLIGFTRALAVEVGHHGVSVNAVCPGVVESPLMALAIEQMAEKTSQTPEEILSSMIGRSPKGRSLTQAEVAHAISWFASEEAKDLNGEAIVLDGGELAS